MCDANNLPYSASLKEAMEKIKDILNKYDIGGNIFLTSQSHVEYLYHFPKWSIAQFKKPLSEGGIEIGSKREDFNKSKDEQIKVTEATAHLIARNRDMTFQAFNLFQDLLETLETKFKIQHEPFSKHTPHLIN